jgi:hypothetical protein
VEAAQVPTVFFFVKTIFENELVKTKEIVINSDSWTVMSWKHSFYRSVDHDNNDPRLSLSTVSQRVWGGGCMVLTPRPQEGLFTATGQVGVCVSPEVGLHAPIKTPSAARNWNSRLHGNSFPSLVKCRDSVVIVNAVNGLNAFKLCIIIRFVPHREHILC